ncbi:hypothetical protein HPB47_004426 [Ixodes persulcatus]|uniref:Uncharacterized protein n=1 Tax=Ixodes persulcatus TaxID=34615 RepID=A0AC60PFS6_IXOPE|nr:hypothetical protein HPB47_004426 [Ixodes persulcatus]
MQANQTTAGTSVTCQQVEDPHFHQDRVHHFRRFLPRREQASVATWTVLAQGRPVSFEAVLKGPATAQDDRHPQEPIYNEAASCAPCRLDNTTEEVSPRDDRKFIVFESSLKRFFKVCRTCYAPCKTVSRVSGKMLKVQTLCAEDHCLL